MCILHFNTTTYMIVPQVFVRCSIKQILGIYEDLNVQAFKIWLSCL